MDLLTIIIFTFIAIAGVIFVVGLLLFFIALLSALSKSTPPIDSVGIEVFESDEPDGSNYYEVRGETRLE